MQQAGFRKNRSTNEQVALFGQTVKDSLVSRNIRSAVYVDFKNAYDLVCRDRLCKKLLKFGINGKMFHRMRSFLDQRLCEFKYGNKLSRSYNLQTGLPQGAVSSCIMFSISINDLVSSLESIEDIKCLLFADDLIIWTQAPKKECRSYE
nr:uncharacterized protein LOC107453354 [Parasteatoda tepidariorum]